MLNRAVWLTMHLLYCVGQDRLRLLKKCPNHVRQLLGWVGSNPRLLVAALSILSGQEASPKDVFLGEILNLTCDGVDVPLIGGGLSKLDGVEMGHDHWPGWGNLSTCMPSYNVMLSVFNACVLDDHI